MGNTAKEREIKSPRRSWKQTFARWIGGAVVCYLGVLLVMLFLENWLLFHPLRATVYWLAPPNARVQDVELLTVGGTRLHAWWCPVKDWQPGQGALLYCHGNAGNLSCRRESIARWQQALGVSVLIFDYPGYGRSEGSPTEAGCYASADAAYLWLTRTMNVPPERVLIYGGSLGGGVAVDLASRQPHRALILVKTFISIPEAAQSVYPWLPARWLVRNRFDNLEKIGRCRRPIFIAHGTADRIIPFAQGKRLFEAAGQPKRFLAMRDLDHNDGLPPEFFSELHSFLEETAPLPKTTSVAAPAD
jgi:fermentation-respiration switch protein FrsA (DUF1100 family)